MGSALRTGLTSAHLVQLAFPALQDLPLLAPPPERSFTELIVAPEVALTRLPAANGAVVAKPEIASVLSPSQVRCFFECQARWWFKYGLQLPERKNSSLALGLAVHQALEVNFREKLETREDLETTGVVCVFRESWMEQVPQTEFTSGESQGDLRRLGERLVAKYMDEVAPKVEPAAVELDVRSEEHTSELQSLRHLVSRPLLEKKTSTPVRTNIQPLPMGRPPRIAPPRDR